MTTHIYAYNKAATTETRHRQDLTYVAGTATASQPLVLDASGRISGMPEVKSVSFTEDGSGTSYVGTIEIPASTLVFDIQFRSTVLWDGTSASLDIGDDDDANGYFAGINLKATDLLVGEVLSITNSENWGGKQGVYLVAATGLKSATYYATANNIIGTITPGAADGSAGRSFMHVLCATTSHTASTNT